MPRRTLINIKPETKAELYKLRDDWFDVPNDNELILDMISELRKAFESE